MANLDPINPLLYIKPHDPIPEKVMDSSAWFVTERVTINFGESVGRPEPNAVMKVNMIGYLLQQGWYIEAVRFAQDGGNWRSVTKEESRRIGDSTSNMYEQSHEDSSANSTRDDTITRTGNETTTRTGYELQTLDTDDHTVIDEDQTSHSESDADSEAHSVAEENGDSHSDGHASNRATNPVINAKGEIIYTGSEGDTDSNGDFHSKSKVDSENNRAHSEGEGKDTRDANNHLYKDGTIKNDIDRTDDVSVDRKDTTESNTDDEKTLDGSRITARSEGARTESSVDRTEVLSYWSAAIAVAFVRRKISTKRLLGDMIKSFTDAYNEGRRVNDERYDEIVALYALMLGRTEDEANAFSAFSPDFFKPLADDVMGAIKDAVKKYQESASDIPNLKNRIDEINRKFDALLSQKRSEAISIATYNSTVWTTTESGIERDRQLALNDAEQEIGLVKIKVAGDVATIVSSTGDKILDCGIRIIEAQRKFLLEPTNLRNQVFKWMLDFMERRKDEYPALDKIAGVAATLGVGTDNGTTTAGGD